MGESVSERAERFRATLALSLVYSLISGGLLLLVARYGLSEGVRGLRPMIVTVLVGIAIVTAWALVRVWSTDSEEYSRDMKSRRRAASARPNSCPDGYVFAGKTDEGRICSKVGDDNMNIATDDNSNINLDDIDGIGDDVRDGTNTARCTWIADQDSRGGMWSDIGC